MMNLCKLLGFPDRSCRSCRNVPPREDDGLRCVIEGSHLTSDRGDPGSWGLQEAALGLCTESLGSESSDTVVNFEEEPMVPVRSPRKSRRSSAAAKRRSDKFPPPLPWLSESGGRRSCFMKGEKKEGRFLLKEVKIERPEVMRASRQNGRLRLQLIESESESESESADKADHKSEVVMAVRCQEAATASSGGEMWWKNQAFLTTA